jgi:hypothetical protein
LSAAVAYIHENGEELERARLAGLLGRSRAEPKVARSLLARQNEDGGFPFGLIPGRPSAITATATALQWMEDLHLLPSSYVERAAAYLLTIQRPDGAWEESPGVLRYDPPAWARPGSALARGCCTALALSWMVRLLGRRYDAVIRSAAFLRTSRNDGWPPDEPAHITATIVAALLMVDGSSSAVAAAGVEVLRRLAPETWTTDRLAEALAVLHLAGVSADDPLIASGLQRLLTLQRPDGGWSSEYGPDRDVDLSLHVLSVLLVHGVSTSSAAAQG